MPRPAPQPGLILLSAAGASVALYAAFYVVKAVKRRQRRANVQAALRECESGAAFLTAGTGENRRVPAGLPSRDLPQEVRQAAQASAPFANDGELARFADLFRAHPAALRAVFGDRMHRLAVAQGRLKSLYGASQEERQLLDRIRSIRGRFVAFAAQLERNDQVLAVAFYVRAQASSAALSSLLARTDVPVAAVAVAGGAPAAPAAPAAAAAVESDAAASVRAGGAALRAALLGSHLLGAERMSDEDAVLFPHLSLRECVAAAAEGLSGGLDGCEARLAVVAEGRKLLGALRRVGEELAGADALQREAQERDERGRAQRLVAAQEELARAEAARAAAEREQLRLRRQQLSVAQRVEQRLASLHGALEAIRAEPGAGGSGVGGAGRQDLHVRLRENNRVLANRPGDREREDAEARRQKSLERVASELRQLQREVAGMPR